MANKYAKPKTEQKKSIVFSWKWTGNRTPDFVNFPSGKKVKVEYMRDNIILFEDGNSGSYQRTWDDNKTQERTIIIEIEVE